MKKRVVIRKIYPEDYKELRKLVFMYEKGFIEVLEELYIVADLKIEELGISYYYQYEFRTSSYLLHRSISVPIEFNEFLIKHSSRGFPAKQLLSAIIQDYVENNIVKKTST